jgi:hypothetical protein
MIPTVGTPVTLSCGSDSNPGTVVEVCGNIVTIRDDKWKVVSGGEHDGSAEYEYSRNPHGNVTHARWRNGAWEAIRRNPDTNRWNAARYPRVFLGYRRRYYDPHF